MIQAIRVIFTSFLLTLVFSNAHWSVFVILLGMSIKIEIEFYMKPKVIVPKITGYE